MPIAIINTEKSKSLIIFINFAEHFAQLRCKISKKVSYNLHKYFK